MFFNVLQVFVFLLSVYKCRIFDKPAGLEVHGKPAQELNASHCNGLFDGIVAVIFGKESYLSIGDVQDTLVGNGHAVGVLSHSGTSTMACSTIVKPDFFLIIKILR